MKRIISLILLFITFTCQGSDKVSVSLSPSAPIMNEPFELIFKIKLTGEEEPYISFDPGGASVTGRSNGGVSLKTTMINGSFTTSKEVTYVYSMLSTRSGTLFLKNIEVDFGGGKKEKLKNIRINVKREAQKPKDIFVMAIPSKTEVYIGEGFDVNYYLYNRVNVMGSELEKYPTLGDFLKRFHLVNESIETVKYKGELYRRSLKYSARLFAQKSGTAKIDPLKLKVQYSQGSRRSSFGFGIQLGKVRVRSFQSSKVEVNVLPLPTENVPPYFTGLVGEHEFKLHVPRDKFVVNEAIEAKLEVQGVGALEAYAAPKLFNHKDLEEFDTKGELQPINKQVQKKMFEYTYLARSAFNIEAHLEKVAYFDPEKKVYVTKEIQVPRISISGGAAKSNSYSNATSTPSIVASSEGALDSSAGIVGVNLGKTRASNKIINTVNTVLVIVILLVLASLLYVGKTISSKHEVAKKMVRDILKGNLSFSSLYGVLNMMSDDMGMNIYDKIRYSSLSEAAKKYFISLLESLERGTYSTEKVGQGKINKKYFKELKKVMR